MPTPRITKKQEGDATAIELVEGERLPDWAAEADLAVVGTPRPRLEGHEKVTGRAIFLGRPVARPTVRQGPAQLAAPRPDCRD